LSRRLFNDAVLELARASWSAVAEMPGASGIDDTAFDRQNRVQRPNKAIRLATAVSRQGLPLY
jgi:hypothetical protein